MWSINDGKKLRNVELLALGDRYVGKTALLRRFGRQPFTFESYHTTVGLDIVRRVVSTDKDNSVCVKIWDTAGQERFHTVTRTVYQRCSGAMVVFDLGNRQSFLNVHAWVERLNQNAPANIIKCLVGNKADIAEREVTTEEAQKVAEFLDMPYFETSASVGMNVDSTVAWFVQEVCASAEASTDSDRTTLSTMPSVEDLGAEGKRKARSSCAC